jgi:alpha-1,3-rhamnosyl/mannosyltransferase
VIPAAPPLYHPLELAAWPALLRAARVDLLHVPYFWAPMPLACPLVVTIHDMIFDRYPAYMPRRRLAPLYRAVSRAALRRARRVIAVSEATRQEIVALAGTPAAKIAVVHEGIDGAFRPVEDGAACAAVRRRYGLPRRYVLALGARRPHKNIGRLLRAFAAVAPETPHSLVLAGPRDERFAPEAEAELAALRRAGRLVETGSVAEGDLPALYAMADLFVQPSIVEGFGLPVLEAMACGCPVLCSNTSSLPEVAGDAALFFDPRSVDGLAWVLRAALAAPDMRAALAARGRARAASFEWGRAAGETLAVYRAATRAA